MTRPYLSPRQRDCIRLAAAGLKHRHIAERLGLDFDTVRQHLARARQLLGAHNTAHATALAVHHGIVTAEHLELP